MGEHHHHEHPHVSEGMTLEEAQAMLIFSLKHNRSHNAELDDLAEQFYDLGKPEVHDVLHEAAAKYLEGTKLMEEAVKLLGGEV